MRASTLDLASIQALLIDVWTEVLGVEVSPGDDFFAFGGDSIASVQVASRLSQLVGSEIPPTLVYAHTTVEQLAVAVDRMVSEAPRL